MQPDETWRALRAISLLALALLVGVQVLPALRPHRKMVLGVALVVYLLGGAAIFGWALVKGRILF